MLGGVCRRRCVDTGKVTRAGDRREVATLMGETGRFRVAM